MAFSNELDIFLPQTLKDEIWNLEYIDLSLLLRQILISLMKIRTALLLIMAD